MKALIAVSITLTVSLLLCDKADSRSRASAPESQPVAAESSAPQKPSQPSISVGPQQQLSWEEQGKASTGESISLNLDSVQVMSPKLGKTKSPGYFFQYKIGPDRIYGMTYCNGEFSTSRTGHRYGHPIQPKSEANRRMLDRVCTYRSTTMNG